MSNSHEQGVQRRNSDLLVENFENPKTLGPIIGYAQEPLLPLADACAPLTSIVHDILIHVSIALEYTPDNPADNLTRDESASIRLYTMVWTGVNRNLYSILNRTLKTANREELRLWFKYLKLLLTAVAKIPSAPPQIVWRGVRENISDEFPVGAQVTWWAFSPCTTKLSILESDIYLGKTCERTIFYIEVFNARNISAHSNFDTEDEILLLPGTYMEVQSQSTPTPGLHIVHLKQKMPKKMLLEPPFEGACLYPKINTSPRHWYRKKRFFIPVSLLAVLLLVGVILGSVLGSISTTTTIPKTIRNQTAPSINWNGNDWAMSCNFTGNDLSNVQTSAPLCGPQCVRTHGCTHYTWNSFNGGTCWMKKNNVTKNDAVSTNDPTMVCGIVDNSQQATLNSTVQWNGNDWATSCNFTGNDLSNVQTSAPLCGPQCAQTQGCTHYTWTSFNGGTCWMKKNNVTKNDAVSTNDPTMVCGIVDNSQQATLNSTVQWNGNNWAISCNFTGNDLSNVQTSAPLCGPQCAQTQGCTHYTWTSFNGGTCWMKTNNVTKNDAVSTNDPTMVCGIVDNSQQATLNSTVQWNGNNWATSCNFTGNDLSKVQTSAPLCGPQCVQTQGCTHYTWTSFNNGTCWMKTNNVSKNDAILTNDPTMVCGIVDNSQQATLNSTVQWNGNDWATSCNFTGNDLSNVQTSATLCGPQCAQTQGCTHYTWSSFNNGTCWMKTNNVSKNGAILTNDPTMVCGIVVNSQQVTLNSTVQWNGNNWAMSCNFTGNDLSKVQTSAPLCGSQCVQTQGCTHYTWTSFNGGTCWMKTNNVTKNDAILTNDPTMVCGIVTP